MIAKFEVIDIPLSLLHMKLWLHVSTSEQLAWYLQLFFMRKKHFKHCNIFQKGKILLGGLRDKATLPLGIQTCFTTNSFVKKEAISEPETHEQKHSHTIYNSVP